MKSSTCAFWGASTIPQAVEAQPHNLESRVQLGGLHQGQGGMLERTHIPKPLVVVVDKKGPPQLHSPPVSQLPHQSAHAPWCCPSGYVQP